MEISNATLQELINAARDAAEILQLRAQALEKRGESSSIERIAVMNLNMALLAVEDEIETK